jgi:flagellar biosynthesis/type III secretory pathway M-ring protein FliF/YscJ
MNQQKNDQKKEHEDLTKEQEELAEEVREFAEENPKKTAGYIKKLISEG